MEILGLCPTFIQCSIWFLGEVPRQPILNETIRNVYYHVPMWFTMMALMISSLIYSVKYLRSGNIQDDIYAVEFANVAIVFGILGFLTGMIWAFHMGRPIAKRPKIDSGRGWLADICSLLCS